MVNPTQYRCSRCGALKNANELNGLDLITGDVSHAFCIRLAECQSAEADDIMNELCDALEASDDTEQAEEQAPLYNSELSASLAIEALESFQSDPNAVDLSKYCLVTPWGHAQLVSHTLKGDDFIFVKTKQYVAMLLNELLFLLGFFQEDVAEICFQNGHDLRSHLFEAHLPGWPRQTITLIDPTGIRLLTETLNRQHQRALRAYEWLTNPDALIDDLGQAPAKPEPVTDLALIALDRLDAYERALDDSCPEYLHLLARVEQLANVGGCLCVMFNGHGERVQARQQSIRAAALACAQEQDGVYPVVVSGANLPDGEALLRRLVVAMGLLVHPHFQALEQLEFLQTRLEDSAGILLIVERAQCLNSHHLRALKGLYQLRSQGNRLVKILLIGEHDGLNSLTTGLKDSGLYDHTEVCHYDGQYRLENWGQALGYDDRAAPVSLQGQTRQDYNRALFKVLAKHTNEEESKVFSKTLEAFCAQMLVRRFNPGLNDASYHVYSKFCQAAK